MSESRIHLEPVVTDRGFRHMPPITDGYGSSVHVYESSAADGPHVWMKIRTDDSYENRGTWHGSSKKDHAELCAHLTLDDLVKLGEQIEWFKKNHYQGAHPSVNRASRWSWLTRLWGRDDGR